MSEHPEQVQEVKAILARDPSDLGPASCASALPPYNYISLNDRNEISDQIIRLSKELARALKDNDLDSTLFLVTEKLLIHRFRR